VDSAYAGVRARFGASTEPGNVTSPPKIKQGIERKSKQGYVSEGTTVGVAAATVGLQMMGLMVPPVDGAALSKFRHSPEPDPEAEAVNFFETLRKVFFVIVMMLAIFLGVWKLFKLIGVIRRRVRDSIKYCYSGFGESFHAVFRALFAIAEGTQKAYFRRRG
jgi:hypothetical protein